MHRSAGDCLQRSDDLARYHDGIDRFVRHRSVAAMPVKRQFKDIVGRHQWTRLHRKGPEGLARPIVQAVDRAHREATEEPFLDHPAAAALVLFRRLKDEMDGAGEVGGQREMLGGAEKHGHMSIVSAGVHLALPP